jgi:DNA-binding transcriptional ArsR family regulator
MDALTFTALAEPNRLRIVELLRKQPYSVNEVAELLKIRQPQASKHLQTLTKAGLVTVKPLAQQRMYELNPEPFIRLEQWANAFAQHWDQKLSSLEIYLRNQKP